MKIKGVIEDLKINKELKKLNNHSKNSKTISRRLSLVLLWAVWGQFIFRQFLDPAYISQDLQALSCIVGFNLYRVLIYFIYHFQGGSLCFSFFCLLVSSVSNSHPDTGGGGGHFFRLTRLVVLWREGRCKQITLVLAHSVLDTLGLPLLTACVLSLSTLLRLQVALPGTI